MERQVHELEELAFYPKYFIFNKTFHELLSH